MKKEFLTLHTYLVVYTNIEGVYEDFEVYDKHSHRHISTAFSRRELVNIIKEEYMGRFLTMKQKRLLLESRELYPSSNIIRQLECINDYETLIQDAQRFLADAHSRGFLTLIYQVLNPKQAELEREAWMREWR